MGYFELQQFIDENCNNVRKLKTQLTEKNYNELMKKFTIEEVHNQLMNMENYKPLANKYTSVYLTLLKWFELDEKKGFRTNVKPIPAPTLPQFGNRAKQEFLRVHPIGSSFEKNGRTFIVEDENFLRSLSEDALFPINHYIKVS